MAELTSPCPKCGAAALPEHIQDWAAYETVPVICAVCDTVFWVAVVGECQMLQQEGKGPQAQLRPTASAATAFGPNLRPVGTANADAPPDLPIGSDVEVILREHVLYGKVGQIVEKKHRHYRVAVEGRKVVLPDNGIRRYHG